MSRTDVNTLQRFRDTIRHEYADRFPRSLKHVEHHQRHLLDATSHAIRWNEPFMPIVARADGSAITDLDGHRIVDYWQGHLTNVLGHNPPLIRSALAEAIEHGRGLQSGMLHPEEGEVAELICKHTETECARLTTSGSLGTFYAVVLARAFTGRDKVLKISGGWHGSQPFGLKGVAMRGESFDHLESEGLSSSTGAEIVLTRFNDTEDLEAKFATFGDDIACMIVEPMLSSGGGMPALPEYLQTARRLTDKHGALLLCDEIITAFRFRLGDLSKAYGVKPDLLILGKIVGGGMPVAAVAGRREILELGSRGSRRVKFEGGTFSAHELSMIAAVALLRYLEDYHEHVYSTLAAQGGKLRDGVAAAAAEAGIPLHVLGELPEGLPGSSLLYAHPARDGAALPMGPESLAAGLHPVLDEGLLKSTLLLEDVSTRAGGGAVSTAHSEPDLEQTLDGFRAAFRRFAEAELI